MKSIILTLATATIVAAAVSCNPNPKVGKDGSTATATSGVTVMACDETFQNIMEQEIEVYEYQYPHASILSYYLPEQACIDSLLHNRAKMAVTSRPLTPNEMTYIRSRNPRSKMIAVDAIALITNRDNPVNELSVTDLGKILTGEITEWKWIEPNNNSGKIDIVFDYAGSSTVRYMTDSIMNGKPFGSNVFAQNSNAKVVQAVSQKKGAIGIIGVSWISSDMENIQMTTEQLAEASQKNDTTNLSFNNDVKVLAVSGKGQLPGEGKKPYQAYIFDGSYPLYRPIYMTVTGYKNAVQSGFFSFVTGFAGQKLLQMTGVLPAAIHPRIVSVE